MFRMFALILCLIYIFTNAEITFNKHRFSDNEIEENYEESINAVRDYTRKDDLVKDLKKDNSLEFNAIIGLRYVIDNTKKKFYFESETPVNFTNIQESWIEHFNDIRNGKVDDSQKLTGFMTMCCDSTIQSVGCAKQFNQTIGVYRYYCLFGSEDNS